MRDPIPLTVPDLDLGTTPIRVSVWHRRDGRVVKHGVRLVELSAGDVVVDLASPADGVLRHERSEDDVVTPGQVIGRIEAPATSGEA